MAQQARPLRHQADAPRTSASTRADEKTELDSYPSSILGTNNDRADDDGGRVRDDRQQRHVLLADRRRQDHRRRRQRASAASRRSASRCSTPSVAATAAFALQGTDQVRHRGRRADRPTARRVRQDGYHRRRRPDLARRRQRPKVATASGMGNSGRRQDSLRHYSSGSGTARYASNRADVWRQAMTADQHVYPGGAFPAPRRPSMPGNGVAVPERRRADRRPGPLGHLTAAGLTYVDGGTQPGGGPAGTGVRDLPRGRIAARAWHDGDRLHQRRHRGATRPRRRRARPSVTPERR